MRDGAVQLFFAMGGNFLSASPDTVERCKVVLSGAIGRAVVLKGIVATKGARAAIEAAGGRVE